ncbi:hypothetical protein [Micromonospora luteifusca]
MPGQVGQPDELTGQLRVDGALGDAALDVRPVLAVLRLVII